MKIRFISKVTAFNVSEVTENWLKLSAVRGKSTQEVRKSEIILDIIKGRVIIEAKDLKDAKLMAIISESAKLYKNEFKNTLSETIAERKETEQWLKELAPIPTEIVAMYI